MADTCPKRERQFGKRESWQYLVIEDVGEAQQALQARGIRHTRLSHFEVLTHMGQTHFNNLLQGNYTHLWISVPRKRHDRSTEQKHHSNQSKGTAHHARLLAYIQIAKQQNMQIFLFGTPGNDWVPYESVVKERPFHCKHLRCCSLNIRFNTDVPTPSRCYAKVYSIMTLPDNWTCHCPCAWKDHVMDWPGSDIEHSKYRAFARQMMVTSVFEAIVEHDEVSSFPPLRLVRCALQNFQKH